MKLQQIGIPVAAVAGLAYGYHALEWMGFFLVLGGLVMGVCLSLTHFTSVTSIHQVLSLHAAVFPLVLSIGVILGLGIVVAQGRLGLKTGSGFYNYEGRDIAAVQRRPQVVREQSGMFDALRRDEIETAALGGRHAHILPW